VCRLTPHHGGDGGLELDVVLLPLQLQHLRARLGGDSQLRLPPQRLALLVAHGL
jgi:hypothetical protein